MTDHELAKIVVDVAFHVHTPLGAGLVESVYQKMMAHELRKRGLQVCEDIAHLKENSASPQGSWFYMLDIGTRQSTSLSCQRLMIVAKRSSAGLQILAFAQTHGFTDFVEQREFPAISLL
jgi:hypothetical protein